MSYQKKVKYAVGDEVIVINKNVKGKVEEVVSCLGEGDNIYLVNFNGKSKLLIESNLRISRKNNSNININIEDLAIQFKIEDKINDIIKELKLKKYSGNSSVALYNACQLQAYLVVNDDYDGVRFSVGNSVTKNELYHGLLDGELDSINNSYIFSEIMKKTGVETLNIAMKSEDGQFYVANLVLIEGEYYYFDVTLESMVYKDNGSNKDDFVLCCAGLGKSSYEQFFIPLCILDFNNKLGDSKLPSNISMEDINIDIINKMLTMGINEDGNISD